MSLLLSFIKSLKEKVFAIISSFMFLGVSFLLVLFCSSLTLFCPSSSLSSSLLFSSLSVSYTLQYHLSFYTTKFCSSFSFFVRKLDFDPIKSSQRDHYCNATEDDDNRKREKTRCLFVSLVSCIQSPHTSSVASGNQSPYETHTEAWKNSLLFCRASHATEGGCLCRSSFILQKALSLWQKKERNPENLNRQRVIVFKRKSFKR